MARSAAFVGSVGASDLLIDVQVAALRRKLHRATPGRDCIATVGRSSSTYVG